MGISSKKYIKVEDWVLNAYRIDFRLKPTDFICICTGELNKNKRQRLVIDALPEIVKAVPNFQLLLAGDGIEKDNLEKQIKGLCMEGHAQLIGYRTDLEVFVNLSDIAVSASQREGLGINLIEAMNCHKPVVGSVNRGHMEFIKNNKNGFLAVGTTDKEISHSFATAIIKLATDKALYNEMADQAHLDAQLYMDFYVEKELKDIYFD